MKTMTTEQLRKQIKKHISSAFLSSDLKGYGACKSGKVRELYTIDDKIMIVTTDRISAFDVVLTQGIPYKGQALNQTSEFWFDATQKIMNNHIIAVPDPNIMIAQHCEPIELEVVIRGYITGSAWRRYKYLKENNEPLVISGVEFPDDLRKDEKLPEPVFTPTTKAQEGHDEEINPKEIISKGIITKDILDQLIEAAFKLYTAGNKLVSKSGGILVDTKYEFGLNPEGEVVLIDEVHTADSSRYWLKEQYEESFEKGLKQKGLDKEYVRSWLRDNGFTGDGVVPDLPDDVIINASLNVINAYELITAQKFKPAEEYASKDRLISNLKKYSQK
ncbi:MAG: phosphoribosylaminoimidazolesuccinocarboxamide synthase [Candidatus Heimdallarchaeota archaeon]|nr:MAG: phosphoribosylaminoimidazolesuccinocarboxamide synthase [Candidatus Heimdallarchaeota archaeon]